MLTYQVTPELALAVPRPAKDAAALFALIEQDRAALVRYLPWVATTRTVADEQAFLRLVNQHLGQGTSLNLVVWLPQQIVGMISCNRFDPTNQSADIGYWLGAPFRGQGLMTQAARGMCDLAFRDYDLNKLTIRAAVDNLASNAVARRAGFQPEGRLRQNERLADGYHDEYQYGLLREEWR
ncbi:GNAT family protein [Levilactobacillus zymae]|uniref:GNAT family N-acetyltransferase n=1 Tax=Levilactobacillus zymae TaxID=267363 RepID=UPI0028BB234F|nr:GNAT family protein [Levilactobacillus zymae]MDT6980440.1 GNAT family protein [Levilactobacillus zymae]